MGGMGGSIIQSASAGLQAVVGRNAIGKAGQATQNGYNQAMQTLSDQYGKTQDYLNPYSQAGTGAVGTLADYMGTSGNTSAAGYGKLQQTYTGQDLYNDPSYQFRLQEGQKALERSASAKGMTLSGGQAKALTNYGQNAASQEYQAAYNRFNQDQTNLYNRLMGVTSMGEQASGQQANLSNQYGSNLANLQTGKAEARAAETMAQYRNWQTQDSRAAGAWSGAIGKWTS